MAETARARNGAAGTQEQEQGPEQTLDQVIIQTLGDRRFQKRVTNVLPADSGIATERFVALALASITHDRAVMACSRKSIEAAVLKAAQLGLEVGGPRQHAAIVPFNGEATLIVMYKGAIFLAVRCGAIKDATPRVVFEGDDFHVEFGTSERVEHTPRFATRDPNAITHAYVVITLPDGMKKFDVMGREEIEYVRHTFSRQPRGEMWAKSWAEAAKKTVLNRALKTVAIGADAASQRFAEALDSARDDLIEKVIATTDARMGEVQAATRTEAVLEQIRGATRDAEATVAPVADREPGSDDEDPDAPIDDATPEQRAAIQERSQSEYLTDAERDEITDALAGALSREQADKILQTIATKLRTRKAPGTPKSAQTAAL